MSESGDRINIDVRILNIDSSSSYKDGQIGFSSGLLSDCFFATLSFSNCCAEGNMVNFTDFKGTDSKIVSGTFSGFVCQCLVPNSTCFPGGQSSITEGVFENVRVEHL